MLKGLDPLLTADILHALRSMGHGDDLILCDANYPAESTARHTVSGMVLPIAADAPAAMQAILSVLPIDTFVDDALGRMEVVGNPDDIPPVQQAVMALVKDSPVKMRGIERFAFYERARNAYCIIQSTERRFYGCFAIRKGVIPPE